MGAPRVYGLGPAGFCHEPMPIFCLTWFQNGIRHPKKAGGVALVLGIREALVSVLLGCGVKPQRHGKTDCQAKKAMRPWNDATST